MSSPITHLSPNEIHKLGPPEVKSSEDFESVGTVQEHQAHANSTEFSIKN